MSISHSHDRRNFLLTAGLALQSPPAAALPPVGVIGSGGRGRLLTAEFKEIGAPVTAVADVYEPNLAAGLKVASSGARPYRDYRKLLDDPGIRAVIIATPDHWHARMVIDAVEAGKDVYVEKPMTHTISEALDVTAVVRRTNRIVQVGMQRRSYPLFQNAHEVMRSGVLGNIRLVTSWWLNHQDGINTRKLDGELDWKQWLGNRPQVPVDALRFFNWYYFYDYSGGLLIGQAAHVVDAIHWLMNSKEPLAVTCSGGRVNLPGVEIPETASATMEYPENYIATFTIGYKAMRYPPQSDQLKQFHGDKARLDVGREHWALYPQSNQPDATPTREERQPGSFASATRLHIRNFLDCVTTRKQPNAPVEAGLSTRIVLSMMIESLRSGRRIRWNPQTHKTEA